MNEVIKKQILRIRDSGLTNMFDINMVRLLAETNDYFELIDFLDNHKTEYCNFILYGD